MSDIQQQDTVQDPTRSDNEPSESVGLPGRRLRETRENKHLSREEVAHHLRLDVQLIVALEEDDYTRLPSPAYICGYLRSYARLLKLPENEIVQAYSHGEQINADLIPSSVNILPQKPANTALLKIVVILVVLALLGAGVYYLIDRLNLLGDLRSDTGAAKPQQSSELTVPLVPKPAAEQSNEPVAQANKPQTPATEAEKPAASDAAPAVPPAELATGITRVEKLPTPKTSIPASEPVETAAPPQANSTTTKPAGAQPATSPNAVQADKTSAATAVLRMHFTDSSWVEVTDSTNKRLVYQLVEKDSDLNLTGVPPFTVLLGNASAVQVFYKGKQFDHTNYRHDQVAYFRVGTK